MPSSGDTTLPQPARHERHFEIGGSVLGTELPQEAQRHGPQHLPSLHYEGGQVLEAGDEGLEDLHRGLPLHVRKPQRRLDWDQSGPPGDV